MSLNKQNIDERFARYFDMSRVAFDMCPGGMGRAWGAVRRGFGITEEDDESIAEDRVEPLDTTFREYAEQAFDANFQSVRIHTGPVADTLTREAGAQAITIGDQIYFAGAEYNIHTEEGRRLIIHELQHVVQHKRGARMVYVEEIADLEAEAVRLEEMLAADADLRAAEAGELAGAASSSPTGGQQTVGRGSARGMPRNAHGSSSGGNLEDFRRRRDEAVYRMHLDNGKVVELTAEEREAVIERSTRMVRDHIAERQMVMTEEEWHRYALSVYENIARYGR